MNSIHFFQAYSRLGMINIPHKGTELNLGVEFGSDAILTDDFLKCFHKIYKTKYKFPLPEEIDKQHYGKVIALSSNEFKDKILNNLKKDEIQIVIGGDHSVTLSSICAVLERTNPEEVGYIQFDSHSDINKFSTSHTGNFHGMFLRPVIGDFDDENINKIIKHKLPVKNILYIGNMDLDEEELRFIKENKINVINRDNIRSENKLIKSFIERFISRYRHIHVSFDIDVFDKSLVSATGTSNPDGLFKEDVFPLLELISEKKDISIDLVEVNPKKEGAEETVRIAQEVIKSLVYKNNEVGYKFNTQVHNLRNNIN